jgi:hypothetical protein
LKKYINYSVKIITIIIFCIFLYLSGCSRVSTEGLAIYLTKDNILPSKMADLSHVEIDEQPIIGMNDIITYNEQTHELKITAAAFERISQLEVPVEGKSFVVCVDKKPIYWGAFWTPISSISFDGVTIWKPLSLKEPFIITMELAYPAESFYRGDDPRNNPEILESLKKADKLITRHSIETINRLPNSLKGYELYSWLQNNQWHFTLITGTNRNKTLEEIISPDDYISEAGWVQIQVTGIEAIKKVLNKLPQGESIFWLDRLRSDQTATDSVNITLPDMLFINSIKECVAQNGLDLRVSNNF